MQDGKILDISVEQNKVSVIWHLNTQEKPVNQEIPLPVQKPVAQSSHVKDFLLATIHQVFTTPKQKKVVFTKSALLKMKGHHLSESDVKHVVLRGAYVEGKENMISKKYNGYEIGCIAKYEKATNTYLVLSAWKRGRR